VVYGHQPEQYHQESRLKTRPTSYLEETLNGSDACGYLHPLPDSDGLLNDSGTEVNNCMVANDGIGTEHLTPVDSNQLAPTWLVLHQMEHEQTIPCQQGMSP